MVLADLALIAGLYVALQALAAWPEGTLGHEVYPLFRVGAYALGGLAALAGFGLVTLRPFGRSLQRLFAVLWLPVFPFGTLLGLVMWTYLGRPGVRMLFEPSSVAPSPEQRTVAASSRKLAPLAAVALLILYVLSGITVIAVAFASAPTLSETRTLEDVIREATGAPDAGQLGAADIVLEMHRYAAAQADYASANSGFYDRTECLVEGALCIPGHPSSGRCATRFVPAGEPWRLRVSACTWAAPPEERPAGASPTSVLEYAYVARPVRPGGMAYCIGSADRLCVFASDETPAIEGGRARARASRWSRSTRGVDGPRRAPAGLSESGVPRRGRLSRVTGTTMLVRAALSGLARNGYVFSPAIGADGSVPRCGAPYRRPSHSTIVGRRQRAFAQVARRPEHTARVVNEDAGVRKRVEPARAQPAGNVQALHVRGLVASREPPCVRPRPSGTGTAEKARTSTPRRRPARCRACGPAPTRSTACWSRFRTAAAASNSCTRIWSAVRL